MEKPFRIALIVDNPFRDLPSLVIVATRLCSMGAKCYLVPFNLYEIELPYLLPDFVLLNYCRENNDQFIGFLHSLGIKLGVLDTEGIFNQIPKDVNTLLGDKLNQVNSEYDEFYVLMAKNEETRNAIDCYCTWNENFGNYLRESKWFKQSSIYTSGSPRTDLFHHSWKNVSLSIAPYVREISGPMVLLNSSFPMVSPQFQSTKEEVKMMVERFHYSEDYILEWVEMEKKSRDLFIEMTNALAKEFPKVNFVYRPHPFESLDQYKKLLDPLPNLHLIRKGTLDAWLHQASALIHYRNCTTNIEAGLAGVPVLTADWLPVHKRMPILENISISVADLSSMKKYIAGLQCKPIEVGNEIHKNIEIAKQALYYKVDGQASHRVAEAIMSSIKKTSKQLKFSHVKYLLYYKALQPKNVVSRLLVQIRLLLNISIHWSFKKFSFRFDEKLPWDQSPKAFNTEDVKKIIEAIKKRSVDCEQLNSRMAHYKHDYLLGFREGRSIVIENR